MANEVTATAKATEKVEVQQKLSAKQKVDVMDFTGKVTIEERQDYFTRKDKPTIVMTFKNPFDEFEPDFEMVIRDSGRRGRFALHARRALAQTENGELPIKARCKLLTMKDAIKRTENIFAALEVEDIFGSDGYIFSKISDGEMRASFTLLAKDFLNVSGSTVKSNKKR